MNRARVEFVATLFATSLIIHVAWAGQGAQTFPAQNAPIESILQGLAEVEYTTPSFARVRDSIVTKIAVKNVSDEPIARLAISDIWYDKGGEVLTAGRGVINGLLQPGQIQTITIETAFKPGMNAQQRKRLFTHANGDVKLHLVQKFDEATVPTAAPSPQANSSSANTSQSTSQSALPQTTNSFAFDSKGVEFGPWIRRFIAQVKRNWIVPPMAQSQGHVVITFNVHKDGSITDLSVAMPCPVEDFNKAAYGALETSNPTLPLPSEYPEEKAFFTVNFYYNEQPK
jgi:TonB family protein